MFNQFFIGLFQTRDAAEVQYNDLFYPEKRPNIDYLNVFNGEKVNKSGNVSWDLREAKSNSNPLNPSIVECGFAGRVEDYWRAAAG